MKLKWTALLLTVGMAVAYTSYAQTSSTRRAAPDGPPAPVQALVDYLGLSDSQLQSMAAIRDNAKTAAQPIMEQIRAKQKDLRDAMRSDADAATIGALEVEIRDLRDQVKAIRDNAALQAKGSLTPDQQTKLDTLEAAAQLQQEVRAAVGAGLIAPPEGDGPGFGPGGFGGGRRGRRGPGGPGGFGGPGPNGQ